MEIVLKTKKAKEIIDITKLVQEAVSEKKVKEGVCHLFILHTSAALTTADLDNGTDLDMLDAFEAMVPRLQFRHPHNPGHVKDHIISSLIGSSLSIPIEKGELLLGVWQKIALVELGGPKERTIVINFS